MGLGGRIAAAFAGVVAVAALLTGTLTALTTDRQVTGELDQFLRVRAAEIATGQRARPRRDGPSPPPAPVRLANEPDAEVQLLDREGTVTARSGRPLPVEAGDRAVAERNRAPALRTVVVGGVSHRMVTMHVAGGGAVQVARSLDEANGLIGVLRSRLLLIVGAMAAAAAGMGWALARRTTRPLRTLTAAVESVAATGKLEAPIGVGGRDEVGRLARGFRRMLEALRASREQQHRLVQDAAHELRTPLTSVKANIDWLAQTGTADPQERAETLAGVQRELRELGELVDEIVELATGRHEQPALTPVDLADVAAEAVERFGRRTERPVTVSIAPSPVDGDPDALVRAVTNLLANAEKYSPAGEPIGVEVRDGGVWVSDQGGGIPPEDRRRVLDRFYRRPEDRSRPGSGLGLPIVASIVAAHGGEVDVGESEGGGARVGFRLPPAAPQAPIGSKRAWKNRSSSGS